jgi:hypothetical protein
VQADTNSLFTDKKVDTTKPVYIPAKTLGNIGAAAEGSLMAINYFEFFALVQRKALAIVADRKASSSENNHPDRQRITGGGIPDRHGYENNHPDRRRTTRGGIPDCQRSTNDDRVHADDRGHANNNSGQHSTATHPTGSGTKDSGQVHLVVIQGHK